MRYSVRTLIILTALLPPLLAIVWFAAPTKIMYYLGAYAAYPGALIASGQTVFNLAYFSRTPNERKRIHPAAICLLWSLATLALSYWLTLAIRLWGWLLVWGDNPPLSHASLALIAAAISAVVSTVAALRLIGGLVTK